MNDDWRVQVTCPTTATAANLSELLREGDFQHGLEDAAGERVVVSVDGHELFLYAGTRTQAERAAEAVKSLIASSGVTVRSPADLGPVRNWLDGPRERPMLVDAKVTTAHGSWWLEEAFRG